MLGKLTCIPISLCKEMSLRDCGVSASKGHAQTGDYNGFPSCSSDWGDHLMAVVLMESGISWFSPISASGLGDLGYNDWLRGQLMPGSTGPCCALKSVTNKAMVILFPKIKSVFVYWGLP